MRRSKRSKNHAFDKLKKIFNRQSSVVFVTGAGLSAASGLPLFRSSQDSVWSQFLLEHATRENFLKDPLAWYEKFWLKAFPSEVMNEAEPNPGHHAIFKICKRYPETKIITQNIDLLHLKSGIPERNVVFAHGNIEYFRCSNEECQNITDASLVLPSFRLRNQIMVPKCMTCHSPLLPNVLLFDEFYWTKEWTKSFQWIEQASALVFVGTSFSVQLTKLALQSCVDRNIPIFNFNLIDRPKTSEMVMIFNVIGKCEATLVELCDSLDHD